ncbi:MAG: RHS repeat domain-containing protein [Tepidisphaerales bacterium]
MTRHGGHGTLEFTFGTSNMTVVDLYNDARRFVHEQDEEQNLIDGNFHSGSESVVTLGTSGNSAAYAVAQLSGGKIELAGWAVLSGSCQASVAVTQLTSGGTMGDTLFGSNGAETRNFGTVSTSGINAAAIGSDGRVAAAGYVQVAAPTPTADFAAARYVAPSGLEERLWVIQDANHDVTAVTDAFGNAMQHYEYTPYGEQLVLTGSYGTTGASAVINRGFQGGTLCASATIILFRHRFLSTTMQRWMSVDPELYIDGANPYLPMRANAVNGVDPMGLANQCGASTSSGAPTSSGASASSGASTWSGGVANDDDGFGVDLRTCPTDAWRPSWPPDPDEQEPEPYQEPPTILFPGFNQDPLSFPTLIPGANARLQSLDAPAPNAPSPSNPYCGVPTTPPSGDYDTHNFLLDVPPPSSSTDLLTDPAIQKLIGRGLQHIFGGDGTPKRDPILGEIDGGSRFRNLGGTSFPPFYIGKTPFTPNVDLQNPANSGITVPFLGGNLKLGPLILWEIGNNNNNNTKKD